MIVAYDLRAKLTHSMSLMKLMTAAYDLHAQLTDSMSLYLDEASSSSP